MCLEIKGEVGRSIADMDVVTEAAFMGDTLGSEIKHRMKELSIYSASKKFEIHRKWCCKYLITLSDDAADVLESLSFKHILILGGACTGPVIR